MNFKVAIYAENPQSKRGISKITPANVRVSGTIADALTAVQSTLGKLTPEQVAQIARVHVEAEGAAQEFSIKFPTAKTPDIPADSTNPPVPPTEPEPDVTETPAETPAKKGKK